MSSRAFFDAANADDPARIDAVLARSFLSYDVHGTRSRTGLRRYHSDLRRSFPDLRFQVHENIGVLVEGDLIALRTIITGTHTGHYAGVAPTGRPVQTSASHIFRVRDDQFTEHWQVTDTYRILAAIGAIPGVANVFQKQVRGEQHTRADSEGQGRNRPKRRPTPPGPTAVHRGMTRTCRVGNGPPGHCRPQAPIPGQRINTRRCRSHDRCPRRACTEIPGRYP
jgi:predicted ester cyclase